MSELEEKLGAILSNPQMMQQIAAMAQAFSGPAKPQEQKPSPPPSLPDIGALQSLPGLMQGNKVEPEQAELLRALTPYLSQTRIQKLERAMQAAKMAGLASALLKTGNFKFPGGR